MDEGFGEEFHASRCRFRVDVWDFAAEWSDADMVCERLYGFGELLNRSGAYAAGGGEEFVGESDDGSESECFGERASVCDVEVFHGFCKECIVDGCDGVFHLVGELADGVGDGVVVVFAEGLSEFLVHVGEDSVCCEHVGFSVGGSDVRVVEEFCTGILSDAEANLYGHRRCLG